MDVVAPESPRNWTTQIQETETFIKEQYVLNIMFTIREIESRGDYNARGGSGERGAYQFTRSTWTLYSYKYFGELLPMTPENQDEVARRKIEELVDKGFELSEIAAFWNSGRVGWMGEGINSYGVFYSVPNYVRKFLEIYERDNS